MPEVEAIRPVPPAPAGATTLAQANTQADVVGFSSLFFHAIDEGEGIFIEPIKVERKGSNNSPCKVVIEFLMPSSGYIQEEFPLTRKSVCLQWSRGDVGAKEVPITVLDSKVVDFSLVLAMRLRVDSKSGTEVDPAKESATLMISSYGKAPQQLKQKADGYYTGRNLQVVRESSPAARPIIA